MKRARPRTASEEAVLTVVRTACLIAILGLLAMVALAWAEKAIPDQLDRLVGVAAVGAIALLGRTTDTKAEAKDAVEKVVNDLAELGPPMPVPVTGPDGGPIETVETPPSSGRKR